MKNFDIFVGVTVVPLWAVPPRDAAEVRSRANITEAFLKLSGQFAGQLKELIHLKTKTAP